MFVQIGGFQKTSLLDYPDKICAIVFTQGCNLRCGYCHNPELINFDNEIIFKEDEILQFLSARKGKLDAVVITGGEPCLQNDLLKFIKKIKEEGFLVKVDTNGTFPEKLAELLPYIDYVAMDIKAPSQKYQQITGVNIDISKIKKSINLIMNSGVDYEFRTTVVKSQLTLEDFEKIGEMIEGAKRYYLQKFVPSKTLNKDFMIAQTYNENTFLEIKKILQKYVFEVYVRG